MCETLVITLSIKKNHAFFHPSICVSSHIYKGLLSSCMITELITGAKSLGQESLQIIFVSESK